MINKFIKDIKVAYKNTSYSNKIAGFPLFLLFFILPMCIIFTIVSKFELRILIGTIVIAIITLILFILLVYFDKKTNPNRYS